MIASFDGFEINAVHGGDAWKICNLMVANEDRFRRYFPKTLEQNLTPTLSQLFVEKNPTIVNFPIKNLELKGCTKNCT